jgi:hypothetical protein
MFWAAPGAKPPLAPFLRVPSRACMSKFLFPSIPSLSSPSQSYPPLSTLITCFLLPIFLSFLFVSSFARFLDTPFTLSRHPPHSFQLTSFPPPPLNSQSCQPLHSRPTPPRHLPRKIRPWKHHILLLHIAIFIQPIITLIRQVSRPSSHQYIYQYIYTKSDRFTRVHLIRCLGNCFARISHYPRAQLPGCKWTI